MAWLLAEKLEMTRLVKENSFVPVTLVKIPRVKVVYKKTKDKYGYNALVIGILKDWCEWILKEWNNSLNLKEFSSIREVSIKEEDLDKFNVWDDLTLENLDWVSSVNITSFSKWRWFSWAMKRHNFSWGPKTHGSKFHRALGSIGNRKPTRTHKWKKMHWHYGNDKITLKNVPIELVNKNLSVLWLRWPLPWSRWSLIIINF